MAMLALDQEGLEKVPLALEKVLASEHYLDLKQIKDVRSEGNRRSGQKRFVLTLLHKHNKLDWQPDQTFQTSRHTQYSGHQERTTSNHNHLRQSTHENQSTDS